jgi:photosystem II stability/assembly factor-like uncharacterized protein
MSDVWSVGERWTRARLRVLAYGALTLVVAALLAGCAQSTTPEPYGGQLNHIHDILALRDAPNTVLLATHIGLYRTANGGQTWSQVAGGSGQVMDGLMLFKLAQSPVDPKRVYVLAIPRTGPGSSGGPAKATPGLYTSADGGLTWHLASPETALPKQSMFTVGAGSASAEQVYTLDVSLAERGLYTSDDAGAHWRALPPMPDTHPTGVMGDPNRPGRILMWSASTGLYISDDAGQTWTQATGTQGGIFAVSVAGTTIYASGDAGTFVSTDDGGHFTLVNSQYTFSSVLGCPDATTRAYALAGTAVYASSDGGHTWTTTAPTSSHPGIITVDPSNPGTVYVGFSYPVGVEATTDSGAHWRQVIP